MKLEQKKYIWNCLRQNQLNYHEHNSVKFQQQQQLDESMAHRHLKSPRSLSGRSLHLTLVTKWSGSGSWMTYSHPPLFNVNRPSHSEIQLSWSRPCVWSKVKVTFDLKNSKVKVMVKVKSTGHIWGLELNRYVCSSSRGNQIILGWDIANSICDLESSRSRSWPRWNQMVIFEA